LGSLLVTSLRVLDCEDVALWSKMRKLEVRTLQDAKAIVQEVTTTQAEQ